MKQYKAIFIDWDDTIGDFINAAHCSLQDMFTNHYLDAHFLDFQTFYNIYHTHNISLWERYGRDEVTKEYLSFDRFFYPLMMAPVPYSLADAIALAPVLGAEHLEHTTTYFRLLPDAEEVVRKLAERYPFHRSAVPEGGTERVARLLPTYCALGRGGRAETQSEDLRGGAAA